MVHADPNIHLLPMTSPMKQYTQLCLSPTFPHAPPRHSTPRMAGASRPGTHLFEGCDAYPHLCRGQLNGQVLQHGTKHGATAQHAMHAWNHGRRQKAAGKQAAAGKEASRAGCSAGKQRLPPAQADHNSRAGRHIAQQARGYRQHSTHHAGWVLQRPLLLWHTAAPKVGQGRWQACRRVGSRLRACHTAGRLRGRHTRPSSRGAYLQRQNLWQGDSGSQAPRLAHLLAGVAAWQQHV